VSREEFVNKIIHFLLCAAVLYFGARALAEVDPASALLLRPKTVDQQAEKPPEVNLESGRYTIRQENSEKSNTDSTPALVEGTAKKTTVNDRKPVAAKTVLITTAQPVTQAQTVEVKDENENIIEQVQQIFIGDQEQIEKYRNSLSADDSRQNLVELSLAPMLFYTDSKSNYWFRDFSSDGTGLALQFKLWTTPFFGITTSYATTLTSDMRAESGTGRRINADHRLFDVGVKYRKFFNLTRKSPALTFGLDYDEYQIVLPKKETERTRLKTSGVSLVFEGKMPVTHVKSWILGTKFGVDTKAEEKKTALDLKSGSSPSSQMYQIYFGHDYTFNRHQTLFWRLQHRLDKTIYKGTANQNDPQSGVAPSGVAVTQGTTFLQFGFSWGG
jgi:hypothetical protein